MSLPLENPPDGGWGWLIVLSGFLANSLTYGVLRSLGILFEELVEAFDASAAQVSWVTAIALATQQLARVFFIVWNGLIHFLITFYGKVYLYLHHLQLTSFTPERINDVSRGPVGTAASMWFGARPVVMLGGLLSAMGIFWASFSSSLLHLYLTLGFLTGFGWALAFAPVMGTLSRYFSSRRSLAVGLALTGNGLSSFTFSPLLRLLADSLGWRGALLTTSALGLHLLVCGALLRPLRLRGDLPHSGPGFNMGLFAERGFAAFCLGAGLLAASYFTPYVHLEPYGRAMGLGPYEAAAVVSAASLSDALARLLAGCLADRRLLSPARLLVLCSALTACSLLLFPLASSFADALGLALFYGTSAGSFATVAFGVLPEIVGVSRVVNATGLCLMAMSVGGLLGPPLSGFLRDLTGDFTASFLVGGSFVLCASGVFAALPSFCPACCNDDATPKGRGTLGSAPSLLPSPLTSKCSQV